MDKDLANLYQILSPLKIIELEGMKIIISVRKIFVFTKFNLKIFFFKMLKIFNRLVFFTRVDLLEKIEIYYLLVKLVFSQTKFYLIRKFA